MISMTAFGGKAAIQSIGISLDQQSANGQKLTQSNWYTSFKHPFSLQSPMPLTYKIPALIFALAALAYTLFIGDMWLTFERLVESESTFMLFGSETSTAAVFAFGLVYWTDLFGPVAVVVFAVQIWLLRKFRPPRSWIALGVAVCAVCVAAVFLWLSTDVEIIPDEPWDPYPEKSAPTDS